MDYVIRTLRNKRPRCAKSQHSTQLKSNFYCLTAVGNKRKCRPQTLESSWKDKKNWPVASELAPHWRHSFSFLFTTTRTIWSYDSTNRTTGQLVKTSSSGVSKWPSWNQVTVKQSEIGFTNERVLRFNLIRNIKDSLYSEIPCLLLSLPAVCQYTRSLLIEWRWQFLASVRFSPKQTLQGIQYQFIEATSSVPTNSFPWVTQKPRNAEPSVSSSHTWTKSKRLS